MWLCSPNFRAIVGPPPLHLSAEESDIPGTSYTCRPQRSNETFPPIFHGRTKNPFHYKLRRFSVALVPHPSTLRPPSPSTLSECLSKRWMLHPLSRTFLTTIQPGPRRYAKSFRTPTTRARRNRYRIHAHVDSPYSQSLRLPY